MTALTGRQFTLLFLALLIVGVGASYSGSFGIGFVFDDAFGIARNPAIRSLANLPSFFVDPRAIWIDHTQVDLRPVLLITYAVNYAISGIDPWSYHAVNLLLHLIAALLVFVIVRDHLWWPASDRGPDGPARLPAAAAALFFALAPLNSQPVNYIWARSAVLCVTLYLGAFLALLRNRRVLGSTLFALALLTKAIAVTLPVMFLIHDVVYRDRARLPTLRSYIGDWRRLVTPVLLLGIIDVGYLLYRQALLPSWTAPSRAVPGVTSWVWFVSEWPALLFYARQFVWPDALSIDHEFDYTTSLLAIRAWGSLLVLIAWVLLALLARKRYPPVAFATAWFFVTLAPESSFLPLGEIVNDHRPYIASSLGLSLLLAWLIWQGAARLVARGRHAAFIAACLLLLIPAVAVNRYRTWQWADPMRIWMDAIQKGPNNARAWMNAGGVHAERGDLREARRYLERARELAPRYAFVHVFLSLIEAAEGHLGCGASLGAAGRAASAGPCPDPLQSGPRPRETRPIRRGQSRLPARRRSRPARCRSSDGTGTGLAVRVSERGARSREIAAATLTRGAVGAVPGWRDRILRWQLGFPPDAGSRSWFWYS